jgi:hypothetical protein
MVRNGTIITALLSFAIAVLPLAALAQSDAQPETLGGNIATIDAAGNMDLNDDRGYIDSVVLGQATVINPPGVQLVPGMVIRVRGVNRGNVFAATEVDVAQQSLPQQAPPQFAPPPPPDRDAPARMPRSTDPAQDMGLPPRLAHVGDLTGSIDAGLDSKTAYVGQSVRLLHVDSADGSIHDATMYGSVSDITRPSEGRNAQIEMQFDRLQLRDGTTFRVGGVVTNMQVSTKSNALKEVGGALAGMLIGNAIGKTFFDASGGGIAGAVGGYLVAKNNRADVQVPANAAITVRLVSARRQAT